MANFSAILIPILLLSLLLRLLAAPIRLGYRIALNSFGGFVCLWLLNSVSFFTGIYFPINWVTAVIAGFLGLPGIALLIIVQYLL